MRGRRCAPKGWEYKRPLLSGAAERYRRWRGQAERERLLREHGDILEREVGI